MYFIISLLFFTSQATAGTITTFLDNLCSPSFGVETGTLALGKCYNTGSVGGVSVQEFPSCSTGTPTLFASDRLNCATASGTILHYLTTVGSCYYLNPQSNIASVQFFCDTSNNPNAPIANTIASSTFSTSTRTSSTPISSPTTVQTTSPPSSSPQGGLSQSDKIAIGVGIGIGLPALIVAILTLCVAMNR